MTPAQPSVEEVLNYLLPFVISGGDYATTIQHKVASQPAKEGQNNAFGEALTDADLSIQGFIEVALLSRYPQVNFYGEEYASSLNMKYFNQDSELCIYLDPVDGTLYYRDNLDRFNVIISICNRQEVLGAICYIPRRNRLYFAQKGKGARVFTRDEALGGAAGKKLQLVSESRLAITFNMPDSVARLKGEFDVVDVAKEYNSKDDCINMNSLLLGECGALFVKRAGLIDWGAMAFIICEAGGVASQADGSPLPTIDKLSALTYSPFVVSTTPEIHARLLKSLAKISFT